MFDNNLIVETKNCIYTIEILESKEVKVRITGEATFTESTEAFIEGSSHKNEVFDKWIKSGMSMIIRYKRNDHRKFQTVESDEVQTVKIIAHNNAWSYTI